MRDIKQRILSGEVVLGTWLSMGSPVAAEILGDVGFDWSLIDLEHGIGTLAHVLPQIQALDRGATLPFVRVPNHDPSTILKVLDLGARGVMVPQIKNLKQAKRLSAASYYPPKGTRGKAPTVRASRFGANPAYLDRANDTIVCLLQIETASILNQLVEVAQLETVDVLFIGPVDLSSSLGIPGAYDHPLFIKAIKQITHAAHQAGKAAGIILFDDRDLEKYLELGITVVAAGSDIGFMSHRAKQLHDALRLRIESDHS